MTEPESNMAFFSKFARSMTCVLPEYYISVFFLELYHGWDNAVSEA